MMQSHCRFPIVLLLSAGLWAGGPLATAQETVLVPKARLEELERKETELEKLKRELGKAVSEKEQRQREQANADKEKRELQKAKEAAEARASVAEKATLPSVIPRNTLAIASLPALADGQVVDAMDLMIHYRTEPAAAAKRYGAGRIRVAGEIVSFDKPLFVSYGVIILGTTERTWRIACRLEPPANLPALFTAKNGDELVGATSAGARSVLARVGQRIVIEGWCKGLKDQSVTLTGAKLMAEQ